MLLRAQRALPTIAFTVVGVLSCARADPHQREAIAGPHHTAPAEPSRSLEEIPVLYVDLTAAFEQCHAAGELAVVKFETHGARIVAVNAITIDGDDAPSLGQCLHRVLTPVELGPSFVDIGRRHWTIDLAPYRV